MAEPVKGKLKTPVVPPPQKPAPDVSHELQPLIEVWQQYGLPLVVGAAIVLLALGAWTLYGNHVRKVKSDIATALSSARTPKDLEDLIASHPTADAAPLALLKLARAYFDSGNFDAASAKYQEFKTKYPTHEFAQMAEMGRIHCLEARGQLEDALQAFRAFAKANPKHYLTAEAQMGEARCLEQLGKPDEARVMYEDFIASHPDSGWKPRAEELLETVNRNNPRAGTTNTPASPEGSAK